jgi:hypothetical protein
VIEFLKNLIDRTDRWYTKSRLPKTVKEVIFAVVVITSTLLIEVCEWISKKTS